MQPEPSRQRQHWDNWNREHRSHGLSEYMQAQLQVAREALPEGRTLDVGCGTGWLSGSLTVGPVVGVDFSEPSIEIARRTHPHGEYIAGDFDTVEIEGQFDNVVSADCIAHVPDQQRFLDKIATLLRPGGTFLLFTQNPFVWNRHSGLKPPSGQIRNWPSLKSLRHMMGRRFAIERVDGILPGGDRGVLRLVHQDVVRFGTRMLVGRRRRDALYNRFTGRDMVIVAKRK